ncbi:hypothetical protein B296_00019329 [Ensete ventricosum]|uniref:Uncharacterized protein n=1 Tax=Ensete ventricosum TaxID=4639 RepID=A0A426XR96_ENSVE|nr:hypothetical protein B296_00019329 [Ensete ventricosum]
MPLTRQLKKNLNITDLQYYTMALDDIIDAKLEAFTRMEDNLCATSLSTLEAPITSWTASVWCRMAVHSR